MPAVAYSVEAYGSFARPSATADFLELVALSGRRLTRAELQKFLAKVSALRGSRLQIGEEEWRDETMDLADEEISPGDTPDAPAREAVRRVFTLLEQRAHVLEDAYPF